MVFPRVFLVAFICLTLVGDGQAAEPKADDYLIDGHLKQPLEISYVQLGGIAGRLETAIVIKKDNTWSGAFGTGRQQPREGKLTGEQVNQLAVALAQHDLSGLPKTVGSDKPIKSPREIADGASTTITLTFGEQQVTANFADGVRMDEATQKLRRRMQSIQNAMWQVTLSTPE